MNWLARVRRCWLTASYHDAFKTGRTESERVSSQTPDSHPLRWLIAIVVFVAALGLLMPLAVDAVRQLVALSN